MVLRIGAATRRRLRCGWAHGPWRDGLKVFTNGAVLIPSRWPAWSLVQPVATSASTWFSRSVSRRPFRRLGTVSVRILVWIACT